MCARAECAQTTEDRQWRVVRGQSTEGRAAGSRHATRVRAARCSLLNSVSSVPQCGQTGRGPFLIRSMPPPGPMGAATGNGDPRGSSAGRRPAARSPAGGSVIPAVPERSPCGLLMAGAGRGQRARRRRRRAAPDRSRVGTRVVAAVARGAESRDRGRVGGGATHAQSVATRAAAKRGKLITVSEWRAPHRGPRRGSVRMSGRLVDARPPAHAREARARESRRVGCRALAAAGVVRFKSNRFEPRSRTWRLIVHAIRAHSGTVQGMC